MAEKTKKIIELEVDVNSGKVKVLGQEVENVGKKTKETKEEASELTSQLDKMTGGAISGFRNMISGIKGMVTGMKTLRGAIISTGIGALIIAVSALTAAFTSSEEGQNKLSKIMGVIGVLTGNLVDLMADLGEKIISVFENPKQAIQDFANLIKENIVNRFEGLLELIPNLGKAVQLLFEGEFAEAGEIAFNSITKITTGVENLSGKINQASNALVNFGKEQVKEAELAAKVADMRAKADKIERELIVDRSKLESEIALLRLKSREEDKFSAQERKDALLEAQVLEDQLLDKETEYLELRRDAQVLENTFSRSNKENLTKEAEAIAAVNRQVAARANTARQLQRELNTINGQIEAEEKSRLSDLSAFEKQIRESEKQANKEEQEFNFSLIDAEIAKDIEKYEAKKKEEKELTDFLNAQIDARNAKQDAQDKKQKQDREQASAATVALAQSTFVALSNLNNQFSKADEAGKKAAFKRQKALGIASAAISTSEGAVNAYKSMVGIPIVGPVLAPIAAATAIAAGLAQIKSISSQEYGAGPSVSNISSASNIPTAQAQAPQFNTVGTSGFNQLSESIANQNKQPVKAYVVANDVSTAQSLDRNKVEQASFP